MRRSFNYNLNKKAELQYSKELFNVSRQINKLIKTYTSKLKKKEKITQKDVVLLRKALKEYSKKVKVWAGLPVNRLVYNVERQSLNMWKKHSEEIAALMKKEVKKEEMKKALKENVKENVNLITSIPVKAAERVFDIVQRGIEESKRAEIVANEIETIGNTTRARTLLIARTETSRMVTKMIETRAEAVGINWFVWHSVHDRKTRPGHRLLDGVLVKWSDPPSPEKLAGEKRVYGNYLPGGIFNCRCWAAPLIRMSDVTWPARVYMGGKIKRMNKKQFLGLTEDKYLFAA